MMTVPPLALLLFPHVPLNRLESGECSQTDPSYLAWHCTPPESLSPTEIWEGRDVEGCGTVIQCQIITFLTDSITS